jgi:hypothetical protein
MEEWMVGENPGLGIIVKWDGFDHYLVHFVGDRIRAWQCIGDELIEVNHG